MLSHVFASKSVFFYVTTYCITNEDTCIDNIATSFHLSTVCMHFLKKQSYQISWCIKVYLVNNPKCSSLDSQLN